MQLKEAATAVNLKKRVKKTRSKRKMKSKQIKRFRLLMPIIMSFSSRSLVVLWPLNYQLYQLKVLLPALAVRRDGRQVMLTPLLALSRRQTFFFLRQLSSYPSLELLLTCSLASSYLISFHLLFV